MSTLNNLKHSTPVVKLNQPDDSYKLQPLPKLQGEYPYHLSLDNILAVDENKLIFHMVGDTGGSVNPEFQKKVATEMSRQFDSDLQDADQPKFLYHLGDVVYHFGEAEHYYEQFFSPYRDYPAPVFAIAGNHDSDVNPNNLVPYKSLNAFQAVFCSCASETIAFSGDAQWKSMTQPNIYWTLETPLATIIGLHSNVPKYGYIDEDQRKWFVEELKAAHNLRPEKAIIVCIHHAPYSADVNHSSSLAMISFLEQAFNDSGIRPDIIFSGHVHNYQRFHKTYADGQILPFIVAGAGGFDEIHAVARVDQAAYSPNHPLLKGVELVNYFDAQHGFLKIILERSSEGIHFIGEYYTIPHQIEPEESASLADRFSYTYKKNYL